MNTSLLPSQGLQSFSDKSGCCKKHQFIVHLHNAVPVCGKFLMLFFFFSFDQFISITCNLGRKHCNMLLALFSHIMLMLFQDMKFIVSLKTSGEMYFKINYYSHCSIVFHRNCIHLSSE